MTISEELGQVLSQKGLTIGTAESCTGGLIGHMLTNIPGSSDYYMGGVISYSNDAKMRLLNVKGETLEAYGAVSEQTAIEMASGIRKLMSVDIGISVTGIAGPGGGTPTKPVGTTWIGISTTDISWAVLFKWANDRVNNKIASAEAALQLVYQYLLGTS